MKKVSEFLDKVHHVKDTLTSRSTGPELPQVGVVQDPRLEFYRSRKQRGVNLGSWFVLERWISDSPFASAAPPGQSDLDVARGSNAKAILERHWDTWITESDFEWLAQRGVNTVRLPIGYYHLCGADPSVFPGTDFQSYQTTFEGAWPRIVTALTTAQKHGVGVLIDLHAAPGKQNRDSHSGTSLDPAFFSNARHRARTVHVLRILVSKLVELRQSNTPPIFNVVGLELLNEPQPNSHDDLQKWYTQVVHTLAPIDPGMPIYISDCWQTDQYAAYIQALNAPPSTIVGLDHHLYRCFTSEDISTSADQHAGALWDPNAWAPKMFAATAEKLASAGAGLVVGEWSGALNPGSLQNGRSHDEQRKNYVAAQLALFERCCAGWFFWTYKKESPGDTGWSYRDAVQSGVFPDHVGVRRRPGLRLDREAADQRREAVLRDSLGQHSSYWDQYPGHYEHWRFEHGFRQGWDDAYPFFSFDDESLTSVSEMGFRGHWLTRRVSDHVHASGKSKSIWEFEHGYNQGVDAARKDFETLCE
ncbi:glycoside hydrolase family 5 protein [Coniophora puteana RWD-64-598 SS2]|uniref:Glycoside hydrolase family 5 protein n=1 Tax=Coniophora puteana (strain RWD-64-598) TaxID=741705 RepID=A0A5M3MGD6_CONPW|nr:glycoside hydrolase family 5 protein [Coniophora puteana RWD-64-598 SS2]EIW78117.1 glycoside hydrolase family 5 protein [Coniophora puteana RWD-64-598 SS2]